MKGRTMKVNIEIALDCMHYNPIGEAIKYKKLFKYASKYELIDRLVSPIRQIRRY